MSTATRTPVAGKAEATRAGVTAIELPETTRALVVYGPGDYRLETVPVPRATPDEIIVKVEACGICAGDIKTYLGAESFWGGSGQPKYIKEPMIPVHEFVGIVAEVGENAAKKDHVKVGDRLNSEQIVPCWDCRFCRQGEYWMCEKHDVYGFQNNVNGAFCRMHFGEMWRRRLVQLEEID